MQKATLALLVVILLLSLAGRAFAFSPVVQHEYSAEANSGVRHEICTSLAGTTVDTYYTGDYTFDTLSGLAGDDLLQNLRTLMTSTHTYQSSYNDCRDVAVKTDCENGDGTNISLIYSGYIATWADWTNNRPGGWNREHVWPKSLGGFSTSGAGADLHHIRPSDKSINGTRGNEKFGEVEGGKAVNGTSVTGNALGGYSNNTYFEPLDDMKGDVARICLYVHVRYGSQYSQCANITNVFQSIDVLLQWHEMDPVDTWEMGRNEVVYAIQGNRNVFIDYPELAWLIFNREVPQDITTPSGSTCTHKETFVMDHADASCVQDGYSGDTYCLSCSKLVSQGQTIPATGHTNVETRDEKAATCGQDGYTGDIYCLDCSECITPGSVIPASGNHSFDEWMEVPGGGQQSRICSVCDFTETQDLPDDPNRSWIFIVLIAVIAVSGISFLVIRKKTH